MKCPNCGIKNLDLDPEDYKEDYGDENVELSWLYKCPICEYKWWFIREFKLKSERTEGA